MHRHTPLVIGIIFFVIFIIPALLLYGIGIVHIWRPLETNYTLYTKQLCTINNINILYKYNYYLQFNVTIGSYTGTALESIPEILYENHESAEKSLHKYNKCLSCNCYLSFQDMTIYINYDIASVQDMILKLSYASYSLFGAAILPFFYVIIVIIGNTQCWNRFMLGDITKDDALS